MGEKDDSAWVFDSLVGFLEGPIWSAPLLSFIEEKSLVFEKETEDSEEYRQVYQEYKNLVDLLLGCFMEDMGISPEQFEHACSLNQNTKMPIQFQQSLFEQIWAANEYEIFKKMMTQKNLELQLQALNLIEQRFGLTPASLMYDTEGLHDLVMKKLQHEPIIGDQANNDSELEWNGRIHGFSTSGCSEPKQSKVEQIVNVESLGLERSDVMQPILQKKLFEGKERVEKLLDASIDIGQQSISVMSGGESNTASEKEIRRRHEYLKTQRDKLVLRKKEVRSKRLKANATDRPGSARVAAEASLKGNQELEVPQLLESSKLLVRKALAARLKAEVVQK
ncbi:cilia- and flagella-associated protein 36 isoform X1 [Athalia rosae]|uniref:cilia- and flagella-associated protein 36 isoform X1 n=1 Tax=Athalia rosae TaxID=37344 RepID=UPI0020343740|nr:cilia- and flagella-associated protein 36 isoform X1 [Athalia rosae]XP_012263046.2 cilia- and flagella-associated protein 36 isoform X1 [Athalia rosae]XP_048507880.1 cilia- and flagella-associated protein 36 isoform X1 [Athalia rosae]XP_048507881.1 cilia- and flagella-associated protein 36 isoform X1 [Athalia rosae]